MNLPASLAPWSLQLDLLPRELRLPLGALVQRLDLAIGPLLGSETYGLGEPDGFDGLARRGTYDRLLLSEWLLADEVPEEFMRRASGGEHAFLQMARVLPSEGRVSAAILDQGPSQLGAPRIVQLAALIVLDRRALAAGARFLWATAQSLETAALAAGEPEFFAGICATSFRRLLESRSVHFVSDAALAHGRAWLASQEGADDLWLIGGRQLARLPAARGASLLEVADDLDDTPRQVRAVLVSGGRPPAELRLELPEQQACVRLLRDPFTQATAVARQAPARYAVQSNLLFTQSGTKLMALADERTVVAYPVPNSPLAGAGKPRTYPAPESRKIVAAARSGKTNVVISTGTGPRAVRLDRYGGRGAPLAAGEYVLAPDMEFTPPGPGVLLPCLQLYPDTDTASATVILADGAGTLLELGEYAEGKVATRLWPGRVIALAPMLNRVAFAAWEDDECMAVLYSRSQPKTLHLGRECLRVFFAPGGSERHPYFGLMGVEREPGRWTLIWGQGAQPLSLRVGQRAVGIAYRQWHKMPGIVVVELDGRTMSLVTAEGASPILTASAEIVHATVSHLSSTIAYTTVTDELVVFCPTYNTVLYRFQPVVAK